MLAWPRLSNRQVLITFYVMLAWPRLSNRQVLITSYTMLAWPRLSNRQVLITSYTMLAWPRLSNRQVLITLYTKLSLRHRPRLSRKLVLITHITQSHCGSVFHTRQSMYWSHAQCFPFRKLVLTRHTQCYLGPSSKCVCILIPFVSNVSTDHRITGIKLSWSYFFPKHRSYIHIVV